LLDGIHLPHVVRRRSGERLPARLASGFRLAGGTGVGGEPALQGALARDDLAGEVAPAGLANEMDADQGGTPRRVGLAQGDGVGEEGVLRRRRPVAGAIARREAFGLVAKALQEVAHGPGREVQSGGDGGGGFSPGGPAGDLPADK
jgi:hypothetical protein